MTFTFILILWKYINLLPDVTVYPLRKHRLPLQYLFFLPTRDLLSVIPRFFIESPLLSLRSHRSPDSGSERRIARPAFVRKLTPQSLRPAFVMHNKVRCIENTSRCELDRSPHCTVLPLCYFGGTFPRLQLFNFCPGPPFLHKSFLNVPRWTYVAPMRRKFSSCSMILKLSTPDALPKNRRTSPAKKGGKSQKMRFCTKSTEIGSRMHGQKMQRHSEGLGRSEKRERESTLTQSGRRERRPRKRKRRSAARKSLNLEPSLSSTAGPTPMQGREPVLLPPPPKQ